jgi:hypothetical protein
MFGAANSLFLSPPREQGNMNDPRINLGLFGGATQQQIMPPASIFGFVDPQIQRLFVEQPRAQMLDQTNHTLVNGMEKNNQTEATSLDQLNDQEDDSPFICPVCCDEYSTLEQHKKRRPYSYDCGHTTCLGCTEKNQKGKCPFCSKPSRQQIRNFSLEQAIDWAKGKKSSDEASLYKNQSLCLTCKETFDPNAKILFGQNHQHHQVIQLKDKDPKLMKKVFWLLHFIKSDGKLNMDRAETILTMLFNIIDHYLEAMLLVQSSVTKHSLDGLLADIQLFIKHDKDPDNYHNKKLLDSLLMVRDLEVEKSFKMFDLAKDCPILSSDHLDTKFFEEFKKDQESFFPQGMPEKYLGFFPLLRSLAPDDPMSTEILPSASWFETWYSARAGMTAV